MFNDDMEITKHKSHGDVIFYVFTNNSYMRAKNLYFPPFTRPEGDVLIS